MMSGGGYRSQDTYRRETPSLRPNHHSIMSPCHEINRPSTSNSSPDRPPSRPNFTVELRCTDHTVFSKADLEALLLKCKGEGIDVCCSTTSPWRWCCRRWNDAVASMVFLWKTRLAGLHSITPSIKSLVSCDMNVIRGRLRDIFIEHVNGYIEGDLVDKWRKKVTALLDELSSVEVSLKKHNPINVFNHLSKQREGLKSGIVMIEKRILEFGSSMNCILDHLEGLKSFDDLDGEPRLFKFSKHIDFVRIHLLIKRECRRLEDGLPIYAFRQEILEHVHSQQVMVLIGETGSGKSTQLVQYLADSDFSAMESIVCTQPRKLAAVSLAQRVQEESSGCYKDNSIISYPTYSSFHELKSKVIYMTDHCLLQHYMRDKSLSGISCIIIDEAHERSLNTDLLLAMVKSLLCRRLDMRLIIMSATADADKLAEYFFGCETFHVVGRNFPVDIEYVPSVSGAACGTGTSTLNVSEVLKVVAEIHKTEPDGAILAFLTSQMEAEWACETFQAPHTVTLPLHGKLTHDDQRRIFLDYPGRRKVIFSTNLAETSLTIPGVKYVVDSGKMKLSRFEAATSMNVLKVCGISQSSAEQRAGRAGRTAPGKCYRLYSQEDFEMMPAHQEPEIRRVHLGVAVLRIVSMGVKDVLSFDFIDAPDAVAIDKAIQNLIQLEAVSKEDDVLELTDDGKKMVRLGIEPRLCKLILQCFDNRLGKEGVVLAAVTANASTIFCRVGNEEDKHKSDCYKVQFCHRDGDLFTMLSVYKEWEAVPREKRSRWCWENSINAKSMRRCEDMVLELEHCLGSELSFITPSYWCWNPLVPSEHDKNLKKAILSSLAENVAMHSGYDQLGYEVALTGKYVQLHPSCSLLVFSQRPSWIIFVEILSISTQYLVCATAVDFEDFSTLSHPLLLEASKMQHRKLQQTVLNGYGTTILKRFCGKFNSYQLHIVSSVRKACMDERIGIDVNVDQNVVHVYAPSEHMENVCRQVKSALDYERKWMQNECAEKFLFREGRRVTPSFALFGSGAEIKHLELENKTLTVDVFSSDADAGNGKKFLMLLEDYSSSGICAIQRHISTGQDSENMTRWGRITFLTPDAAQQAVELSPVTLNGAIFEIVPSMSGSAAEHSIHSFSAVNVRLQWPRRRSKGCAILRCEEQELLQMLGVLSTSLIDGRIIYCELCTKSSNGIVIRGLDPRLSEADVLEELRNLTNIRILDFFLFRGQAAENPPYDACEDALHKVISNLMPKRSPQGADNVRVQISPPEPKDAFMRAFVTFDGSLHLEAATALERIEGTVLPGCQPWQKIKCQQLFHSSVSCSALVYCSIRNQLNSLIASYRLKKGVNCCLLERNDNGSYRVKISANGTKTVAELRRPLELLMRGRRVQHASITPPVVQLLYSREGTSRMKGIKEETGTHILFDKHNQCIRIFGSTDQVDNAEQKLVQSLLNLYSRKELDIHLRGNELLPPDLMKEVVKEFGPDLEGLKEKVPGAEFTLNTRLHVISVHGTKEQKEKAESLIHEIAQTSESSLVTDDACPICLCKVEDAYRLENCGHVFCRTCLVEQCESAIRNRDSFPIRCTNAVCESELLLTDLRSLLLSEKLDELFRASVAAHVAASGGKLRFCPSPDCPSVYRVAGENDEWGEHFLCGACYGETCRRCHLEYHALISCETYKEFKEDPDSSLREWSKGKEHVKICPVCSYTIEKIDGCNHIECKCGGHICWVCLEVFRSSDDCYSHLRSIHSAII
ncbi:ATP-dependent RNA helicase DEAH11, chloroplastic-like [Impatiens glandulifera]|uniref:ATP-dependent RNA helicase DEAH11, chloroplastic-like n=1 Tax=Impatiens glandulifera TaxID=253017 RepID=UPI001FB0C92E|nr:ATP-dependent RNA helicase DEAH11, chloroplastic-like [Impatiens glandulifera]